MIAISIEKAPMRFSSLSTQLRSELDELDEINTEAEEQVSWLYQLFKPRLMFTLTSHKRSTASS